jgi:hypothetical protein
MIGIADQCACRPARRVEADGSAASIHGNPGMKKLTLHRFRDRSTPARCWTIEAKAASKSRSLVAGHHEDSYPIAHLANAERDVGCTCGATDAPCDEIARCSGAERKASYHGRLSGIRCFGNLMGLPISWRLEQSA